MAKTPSNGGKAMTLVRWDPLKDVSSLQDRINRMFEDFFPRSRDLDEEIDSCAWRPPVDIFEVDTGLIINAELAGVKKEDVSVELKDNVLTIKGERWSDREVDEQSYYRKERCFGTFQRSFTLRETVQPDQIKARFKDGILEIEIPRAKQEEPKQITVDID
jgi:HSP20 family protein